MSERVVWVVECRLAGMEEFRPLVGLSYDTEEQALVRVCMQNELPTSVASKSEYRTWPYAAKESAQ